MIPRLMIVEGGDDRHSVIGLMRAHIDWPKDPPWPVKIEMGKSVSEILATGYLSTYLKTPGLQSLGVVIDADENPAVNRYQRLKNLCRGMFPAIPDELPRTGLVVGGEDGKKLGIWIMPNNASSGSLETFLVQLLPETEQVLWRHSVDSLATARSLGATCRDCHADRSKLYTWMAWQDPPGQSPGLALTKKTLDPHSTSATDFINWFRELYGI